MPCYDPFGDPNFRKDFVKTKANDKRTEEWRKEMLEQELISRLNDVTELLCSVTSSMSLDDIKDEKLKKWIIEHRDFDYKKENK